MKAGDVFRNKYPFKRVDSPTYDSYGMLDGIDDVWAGGCHSKHSHNYDSVFIADAIGFIEFEVLAYVEMPRKYQNRVIYCVTMIDPDGEISHKNRAHSVTEKKFKSWIDGDNAYAWEFEMSGGRDIDKQQYDNLPF